MIILQKNKAAACYRNKVIKNWDAISLIFSRDYATSEDESAGAENAQEMALKGAEDVRELIQNSPSESEPSSQDQGGSRKFEYLVAHTIDMRKDWWMLEIGRNCSLVVIADLSVGL